jgi:hypothetical protein
MITACWGQMAGSNRDVCTGPDLNSVKFGWFPIAISSLFLFSFCFPAFSNDLAGFSSA